MRIKCLLAGAGAAAALAFCAAGAQAADLINNGGFETGDFSGWTVNSGFTHVYSTGYSGVSSHGGQYLA
ncbi:MAG TPA: hypothetical protein VLT57_10245 [Bryobacteraceae bacterium]|nr:hypothetical protein [Bryobacteraceae bacterium]